MESGIIGLQYIQDFDTGLTIYCIEEGFCCTEAIKEEGRKEEGRKKEEGRSNSCGSTRNVTE